MEDIDMGERGAVGWWCPGLNRTVDDCGEPCVGAVCLRVERQKQAPISISLLSEVERLSKALLEARSVNDALSAKLARVAACFRYPDEVALQRVRAVLCDDNNERKG